MSIFLTGLNAEAMDELKQTDGVTDPSSIDATGGTTIVVDVNTDTDTGDKTAEELIQNLSEFEVLVKDSDDLNSEAVRLEDVSNAVFGLETINLMDVRHYLSMVDNEEKTVEAQLDNIVPVASYTEEKSQLNLDATKKFFKGRVEEIRRKSEELALAFFNERCDAFLNAAAHLESSLKSEIDEQNLLSVKCAGYLGTSMVSNNFYAYVTSKETDDSPPKTFLFDIRHAPLGTYRFDEAVERTFGVNPCVYNALNEIDTDKAVSDFLYTVRQRCNGSFSDLSIYYRTYLETLDAPEIERHRFSYSDLLTIFCSMNIANGLNTSLLYLQSEIEFVKNAKEAVNNGGEIKIQDKTFTHIEALVRITRLITASIDTSKAIAVASTLRGYASVILPVFNEILSA